MIMQNYSAHPRTILTTTTPIFFSGQFFFKLREYVAQDKFNILN